MKRLLSFVLFLTLLLASFAASADPLVLAEDLADKLEEPYDESDPSAGVFSYSYRYPQLNEEGDGAEDINYFFQDLVSYDLDFTVPIIQDGHEGQNCTIMITYTVKCNNDDFFSVLIRNEEHSPDGDKLSYRGDNFLRSDLNPGYTSPLTHILGLLDPQETDEWLEGRQSDKVNRIILDMVWNRIEENEAGIIYNTGLTKESLSHSFFPNEHFYMDENGDPVFFLQPGLAADESYGLLLFPIPLEDIEDEL